MLKEHRKTQYKTIFFLEPSPTQHLQKNIKTQFGNHPQILQNGARRPPETVSAKTSPKKHNKKLKNTENVGF